MKKISYSLLLSASLLTLSACSAFEDEDKIAAVDKPQVAAAELYNQAREKVDGKSYKDAIADFEELERVHL
jgi:outer membrane protein assembly factor BamD (BamD/ComL family)